MSECCHARAAINFAYTYAAVMGALLAQSVMPLLLLPGWWAMEAWQYRQRALTSRDERRERG